MQQLADYQTQPEQDLEPTEDFDFDSQDVEMAQPQPEPPMLMGLPSFSSTNTQPSNRDTSEAIPHKRSENILNPFELALRL